MRKGTGRAARAGVLAAALALINAAAAQAYVYWTNTGDSTLGRANLDGSSAAVLTNGPTGPCGIAVDATHIYWASFTLAAGTVTGAINEANLDGTNPRRLISGLGEPCGVAVDASHIYWSDATTDDIGRANLDGSAPEPQFIPLDQPACGVAVDASSIYWAEPVFSSIGHANLNGTGTRQTYINGASDPCGVAVDGAHIYWANRAADSIGRAGLDASAVTQSFIATGGKSPCAVAVDAGHVYWTSALPTTDAIGRAGIDAGSPEPSFITGPAVHSPCGVAVDSLGPAPGGPPVGGGPNPPVPPPPSPPPQSGPPQPPTATITTIAGPALGGRLGVSAAGSTGGAEPIATYAWDFNGDGKYDGVCPAGDPIGLHAFPRSGTYTIGLKVIAANGASATFSRTVTATALRGTPKADPGAVGEGGYACGRIASDGALCVRHVDLDGQDVVALEGGCFTEAKPPKDMAIAPALPTGALAAASRGPRSLSSHTFFASPVSKKIFGKVWEIRGPFAINGLEIDPRSGLPGHVDERNNAVSAPSPSVRVLDTAITLSKDRDVRARFEDIRNRLDVLQMPDFPDVGKYLPNLFGFTLTGSVTPKLVNGRLELDCHMGLPGGFTADVTLTADNHGLHVDEIKAHSDEAPLGLLDIQDLNFDYKPVEDSWEGSATVVLSKFLGIKGTVGFKHGDFNELGAALEVNGLGAPLAPPVVFLNEIGLQATFGNPVVLSGTVKLTAGGEARFFGHTVAAAELNGTVTFTASDPWTLEARGDLKLATFPFADAYVKYVSSGQLTFQGDARIDFLVLHAHASAMGFFDGLGRFQADGEGDGCIDLLGCVGAEAVVSSRGAGICADFGFVHAGGGIFWDGGVTFMGDSCNIAQFRVSAAGDRARAAAADVVEVRGTPPAEVFAATGTDAAPNITVTAPDGTAYASPGGTTIRNRHFVWFEEPSLKTTYVIVAKPPAGTWHVTTAAGNSDLAKVQAADALAAPIIHGNVSSAGALRTLHYRIRTASGERVSFAELGSGPLGVGAGRAIGSAARARGVLRFRPAAGPAGTRTIVALVTRNGLPITQLTVARFQAPAPARPSAPRALRIRRHGTTLTISWRGEPDVDYTARVSVGDGRRLEFERQAPGRVRIADVLPQYGAAAIVSGRNVLGMTGPAASARVGPLRRPRRGPHR